MARDSLRLVQFTAPSFEAARPIVLLDLFGDLGCPSRGLA